MKAFQSASLSRWGGTASKRGPISSRRYWDELRIGNLLDEDWCGSAAYGGSVGLVMLGAAHGRELPVGPAMIGAGLVGLLLFLRLEHRTMGGAAITSATEEAFLTSMRVGLAAFAVFSGLGILLSLGRGQWGG